MRNLSLSLALVVLGVAPGTSISPTRRARVPVGASVATTRFEISFPVSAHDGQITGRVFLALSRDSAPPPIANAGSFTNSRPLFGLDVSGLPPGQAAVIDASTLG